MSKGDGQKIAIKFDKPLLGDVTGNQSAFTISGMQRNPLGVGELELKTYTPSTVERYPVATLYEDDFTGTMDGVEVGGNGLVLDGEETNTYSVNLDGTNDYILTTPISIASNTTWECWVKCNSARGQFLLDHRVNGVGVQPMYIRATGEIQLFCSSRDACETSANIFKFDGQWHHVAAVVSSEGTGYMRIYYDGQMVKEVTGTGNITFPATSLYLGARHTFSAYFLGQVDDVRIWNTARTQQQIQNNMNTELTGNETGLVSYWKFNEGSGTTATDSAGSNDGTISGATYTADVPFVGVEYPESGTYTTTTPADTLPTNPRLKWTDDLPTGTSITAEYAVNQDELTTPETWTPINNNDLLTIPDPATGYFLWLKYTLATTDTAVTPTLLSVWLEEAEAPPDTILLSFDTYNRFNDVEGDITVEYNQGLGTLAGTRPVESFSVDFTPTDLEPTPIDEHTITAGIDLTVDLIDLEFTEIYADHNVTHTATAGIDVTVALINIEDINP